MRRTSAYDRANKGVSTGHIAQWVTDDDDTRRYELASWPLFSPLNTEHRFTRFLTLVELTLVTVTVIESTFGKEQLAIFPQTTACISTVPYYMSQSTRPACLFQPQGQQWPPQVISNGRCQRIWPTYAVIGWLTKTRTDALLWLVYVHVNPTVLCNS